MVGLTGGIGSGKSAVCRLFAQLGVPVIDADVVAREVVEPGQPGLEAIVEAFGEEVLGSDGRLDRARLRELVFSDPERRKQLEALLHPRIRAEMDRRIAAVEAPYCIRCVPLLVETGQSADVDRVLVVDVPVETQLRRTLARDGGRRATVQAIIDAQATRDQRLQVADDVLDNDGDLESLRRRVEMLHDRYLAAARDLPARMHQ